VIDNCLSGLTFLVTLVAYYNNTDNEELNLAIGLSSGINIFPDHFYR